MSKLHELIAVEPDLKASARSVCTETKARLLTGSLFEGFNRHYETMIEEEIDLPDETTEVTTTVAEEVGRMMDATSRYLDVMATKELTNTIATADLIVDGKTVLKDVPAIVLLSLEQEFKQLRDVYANIPVLDQAEDWRFDDTLGYYVGRERESFRTKKVLKNHVKAEATKEHPAQVDVYTEDTPIGRWYLKKFSGMVSRMDRQRILSRVDELIQALKQARQRANMAEVSELKLAEKLFAFIDSSQS